MNFKFKVVKKDLKTNARLATVKTNRGLVATPCFSPVATRASLRGLDPKDIKKTNSQILLANAYHLYLKPGLKVISEFNGFGEYMKWNGPTITDSGGYQVSFLWSGGKDISGSDERELRGKLIKITDKGAYFSSYIDGSKHLLTPEKSIQIQRVLGADIIMAFDQPLSFDKSAKSNREAFERTLKWEERSFVEWQKNKNNQALFGIIQGEDDSRLRRKSLKFILEMDFPGLAIGGKSIGSNPTLTAKSLDSVSDLLPSDKPLHALGLGGGPEGIFEAVERGVDIFDNTSVTRMARTGYLFIHPEDGGNKKNKFRENFKKSKYKFDKKAISCKCDCYTCQTFSRSYINHLLTSGEILGLRLCTIHNVYFVNSFMEIIRNAIKNKDFLDLKKKWLN